MGSASGAADDGSVGTSRRSGTTMSVASATPRDCNSAPRSPTCSPRSPSTAIGSPTSTCAPGGTSVFNTRPSASASTSTAAFSVSTVARASRAEKSPDSSTSHSESTASVALAASSGIRSTRAMASVPRDLVERCDDLSGLGDGRALQHLADAGRGDAAGHPSYRRVEKVEVPAVDLVGQPPAVRGSNGALLGDQELVGLGETGLDGLPVDAGAVEPAQVDHLCVELVPGRRLEGVRRHPEVGQYRQVV